MGLYFMSYNIGYFVVIFEIGFMLWAIVDCLHNKMLSWPFKIIWLLVIILFQPGFLYGCLAYALFRCYQSWKTQQQASGNNDLR